MADLVDQQSSRSLLSTTLSRDGDTVQLTCAGAAETETLGALRAALDSLHRDVVRDATRTVVADVRGLEFASSSCLKVFVTWLQRVQELDEAHQYQIVFRSNPRHSWQRRSLGALATFAANLVRIEAETP